MVIENTKKFYGKVYDFEWGYPTKQKAEKRAKQIIRQGKYLARVKKEGPGKYAVYTRKK